MLLVAPILTSFLSLGHPSHVRYGQPGPDTIQNGVIGLLLQLCSFLSSGMPSIMISRCLPFPSSMSEAGIGVHL
ncbi:hypothetical protein F4802DRAFT_288472 [Xylaria palmicola]|nr:hypothetical protein F4802DRAFT_288472 [Xylaria palmicola]